MTYWLKQLRLCAVKDCIVAVVGNKCDLEAKRQVTVDEGLAFAEEHDVLWMEVSARTGANVSNLFDEIGELTRVKALSSGLPSSVLSVSLSSVSVLSIVSLQPSSLLPFLLLSSSSSDCTASVGVVSAAVCSGMRSVASSPPFLRHCAVLVLVCVCVTQCATRRGTSRRASVTASASCAWSGAPSFH